MIKSTFIKNTIALIFTILMSQVFLKAQLSYETIKAVLIYQFAQNIGLKDEAKIKTYKIGFYGNDTKTFIELNKAIKTSRIKEKPIELVWVKNLNNLSGMQLLYIDKGYASDIENVWNKIEKKNILLVTEQCPDLKYIMLNIIYKKKDQSVSFEINRANIIIENLTIEPELLLLGGKEVDIRELYRDMKNSLEIEKHEVEEQKRVIQKQNTEINQHISELQKLNKNISRLQNKTKQSEKELSFLTDSIRIQQQNLIEKTKLLESQENEFLKQKLILAQKTSEINDKELKISMHTLKLDSLKYESHKQQTIISKQKTKLDSKQTLLDTRERMLYYLLGFLITFIALAISIYRAYKVKKSTNRILEQKVQQRTKELNEINTRLHESEQRLDLAIKGAKLGIWDRNLQTGFVHRNERANEIYGYASSEMGSNINDWEAMLYPDDKEDVLKSINDHIEGRTGFFESQYRLNNKEGNLIWISSRGNVVSKDESGNPLRIIGIISDITDRKKNEIELKNYREHLEQIVDERTRQIVLQKEELKATNEELLVVNDELNKQKGEIEITLQKLKNTQSQLIQSEKMASLGVLTAGVAHEINNPINYISSGLEGLNTITDEIIREIDDLISFDQDKTSKNQKGEIDLEKKEKLDYLKSGIKKLTRNMQTGINRSTEIIESLRTFSRSDKEKLILTDIQTAIESSLTLLYSQYKNRIEIIKNYANIPKINCYPGKISQVFMNLIVNAIQAIENKGVITIGISLVNDSPLEKNSITNYIKISIKDNGKGISKKNADRIFEPFFTTKAPGMGTGLGLSISHSIIEQHHGKIELAFTNLKGTEFLIWLPADLSDKN